MPVHGGASAAAMRGPKIRLRGLSEIATNPLRLILAEQLGGRSSAGFFLVIEITKFLAAAVFGNESGADCPRSTRGETASRHDYLSHLLGETSRRSSSSKRMAADSPLGTAALLAAIALIGLIIFLLWM